MSLAARIGRLLGRAAPAAPAGPRCGACRAFDDDPRAIEAAMPLLTSMGSALSSVRDGDGLCQRHDRYIRRSALCADFAARRD